MSPETTMDGTAHFWTLAEDLLTRAGVEKSTMMGFPCLRRDGAFFACVHRKTGALIIKADRARVDALIDAGMAESFAPNGRVFKEWASIPVELAESWPTRLDEAFAFAGGAA